jgi:DNA polymerase elongation subunit (family B)
MPSDKQVVAPEIIEAFLMGSNQMKYVVAVEANYYSSYVNLVINDPNTGKRIEKHNFKPFVWFKHDVTEILYGGKRMKTLENCQKYGIKIKKLKVSDNQGFTPKKLENGYKYIATCSKSYNDLLTFFKNGGVDIFDKAYSKMFFSFTPVEQFMIQTGIRLFKGIDDYNDVHRFQFDLETMGLNGDRDAIFQIGLRDNRGFEKVLEVSGSTQQEIRDSERRMIIKFFEIINKLKPDVITGFNSESFDWTFFYDRCNRLSIPIDEIAICLDNKSKIKRKPSMLKLGNEQEPYMQTYMYGYNIIDISHSVRRAQAINSDIKGWSLKYITKYSKAEKKNRVYVDGTKIYTTWNDKINQYAFNEENGDWYKITDRMPLMNGYIITTGAYIVKRYLLDDLWETEKIDTIFNQAAFLIAKLLPTSYSRSSTMGTASQWKLIMAAWSYQNDLAIPETESKRPFVGALSRLFQVGYSIGIVKFDFAALYPKTELTHGIFPDLDISGVMYGLLSYIVDTRDRFKFLVEEYKERIEIIETKLKDELLSKNKINELKKELAECKELKNLYDKKQLPLKILANSWFGAYGAPYIFNWGDTNCAEETTCRGRQYFRLMVRFFTEKYSFKPLVGDTDGANFAMPENINDIKYTAKGTHWKTEKNKNKELIGLQAVLAEFNETYMTGRMGLDIDDMYDSTINFSRKNYANSTNGKIKFVGNSIKSKKMPVYIEEFLDKGIRLLLDGKGQEFITYYHSYVDKIYNFDIPMVKIASKSKVKKTISEYKKNSKKKNKAGKPMPKQAHMELAIQEGLNVNLGDTIYYVNTGSGKSIGDLKTIYKHNMSKKDLEDYVTYNGSLDNFESEIQLNCKLIESGTVEHNLDLLRENETYKKMLVEVPSDNLEKIQELNDKINSNEDELVKGEYNVPKYLEAFNKKIKPLLVCFSPEIRDKILLTIKKDRKTKIEKLDIKSLFTTNECLLKSGHPYKDGDQDTYEELMTMEDGEIKFWTNVNKIPNNIDVDEWEKIKVDYFERKIKEKEDGLIDEAKKLDDIFKKMEISDYHKLEIQHVLPIDVILLTTLDDNGNLISRKWGEVLCPINDIFKYEDLSIERDKWYLENNLQNHKDKYKKWLEYSLDKEFSDVSLKVKITDLDKLKAKTIDIATKLDDSEDTGDEVDNEDEDDDEDETPTDEFYLEQQKIDFEIESRFRIVEEEPETEYIKELFAEIKSGIKLDTNEWNF